MTVERGNIGKPKRSEKYMAPGTATKRYYVDNDGKVVELSNYEVKTVGTEITFSRISQYYIKEKVATNQGILSTQTAP